MEKRVARGGAIVGHNGAPRKVSAAVIRLLVDKKNELMEKGTLFQKESFVKSLHECHKAAQQLEKPGFNTSKLVISDRSVMTLYAENFPEELSSSSPQNEAREKGSLQGCNAIGFGVQCVCELLPKHVANIMLANTDRKTFFLGEISKKPRKFRGQRGDGRKFKNMKKSVKNNHCRGAPRRTLGNDVFANYTGSTVKSMLSFKDDSMTGKPIVRIPVL